MLKRWVGGRAGVPCSTFLSRFALGDSSVAPYCMYEYTRLGGIGIGGRARGGGGWCRRRGGRGRQRRCTRADREPRGCWSPGRAWTLWPSRGGRPIRSRRCARTDGGLYANTVHPRCRRVASWCSCCQSLGTLPVGFKLGGDCCDKPVGPYEWGVGRCYGGEGHWDLQPDGDALQVLGTCSFQILRQSEPKVGVVSDSHLRQRFSRVGRVTGIEPALSAWECKLCPPERTRNRVRAAPM